MKEKTKKKAIVTAMIAALLGGGVLPAVADSTGTDAATATVGTQQPGWAFCKMGTGPGSY